MGDVEPRAGGRGGRGGGNSNGGGAGLRGKTRGDSRGGESASGLSVGGARSSVIEDARDIITNRKNRTWSDDEREQMRNLGGKCSRCRGNHRVWNCPYEKSSLVCSYPPCFRKVGHTIGACHDLMKRCRLEICEDQREHRATCHSFMEDRDPYGYSAEAVKTLKETYENHKYILTRQEKKAIMQYEKKELEVEKEKEKRNEEEEERNVGDEDTRDSEEDMEVVTKPSPYGRGSWIFGGFGH